MQIIAGNIHVDGQLLADGQAGNADAGSGSGGSISLVVNGGSFSGTGTIRALGGSNAFNSGGLGRIVVKGFTTNTFSGALGRAATIFVQAAGTGGVLTLDSTTITVNPGETKTWGSIASAGGASTIINKGTIALTTDALTVPNLVTLIQDGIVRGADRADPVIGSFTIASGGVVTHSQGLLTGVALTVDGPFEVQAGGKIDVTAKGYRGLQPLGETYDVGGATTVGGAARGASHASFGLGGTNALYGSETDPAALGSGGGSTFHGPPGNGGGRIQIRAESIRVDGLLLSDGQPGHLDSGSGSGGSISLFVNGGAFSGTGTIRAVGGVSNPNSGGLGRIAVKGFTSNTFSGTLGRAGTIFVQPAGTGGVLTLDSTTITVKPGETKTWGAITAVNGPSTINNQGTIALTTDALTVPNLVTLIQDGIVKGANRAESVIGSFTIASGGFVTHTQGLLAGVALSVAGTFEVQAGGQLNVTAKGHRGLQPLGETYDAGGAPTTVGGAARGASYGSVGSGGPSNALYGSDTDPAELGSGGGSDFHGPPGNGGGRINIRAGSVRVDGQLLADGQAGNADAGSGSGGSISLVVDGGGFSGTGTIRALGGANAFNSGGLGRIAVKGFTSNSFTGALGRAATIFVQALGANGDLTLDGATVTLASGASRVLDRVTVVNQSATFQPELQITQSLDVRGGTTFTQIGALTNLAAGMLSGGTFTIAGTWKIPAAGILANQASILVDGASAQILNATNTNALANLSLNAAGARLDIRNGKNLTFAGTFVNAGELVVGPASTLTTGLAQSDTGKLTIELAGTPASGQFGRVIVPAATFNGTLHIAPLSYTRLAGQSYTIMTFGSSSGAFDEVTGLRVDRVPAFETVFNPTNVIVNTLVGSADLAIDSITVPASAEAGQDVSISYQVRNVQASPANGSWFDSLYLSTDNVLDADDRLITRIEHQGGVAALATYQETYVGPLPAAPPGDYRVIVVADSRGLVPDSQRANNTQASAGVIERGLPALALGQTLSGTIASGEDLYLRLDLPAATVAGLTAEFTAARAAEFYVRYGALPDRTHYDQSYASLADLQQHLTLTGPAGRYYVLLHGREGAGTGQPFSLSAAALEFGLQRVQPDRGSQAGEVTLTLSGAGFTPATTVALLGESGITRAAHAVIVQDGDTLFATFDLNALLPGEYDVRIDDGARSATAGAAFTVTTGAPGKVEVNISSPAFYRYERGGTVIVDYVNVGETDVLAPLLTITADNAWMRIPGTNVVGEDNLQFLGINHHGPAGVLPPGARGQILLNFDGKNNQFHLITNFQVSFPTDFSCVVNWPSEKDSMRPAQIPTDAWEPIFANFVAAAGTTVGQYNALLAQNATALSRLGQYTPDIGRILGFVLQQSDNAIPGRTLASSTDAAATAPGFPLSIGRSYSQSISDRYRLGVFGRGWSTPWESYAIVGPNGDVTIQTGSSLRKFIKQADSSYRAAAGDASVLTVQGGAYHLREASGGGAAFEADGRLQYIEDARGNRITTEFVNGRLTGLAHSSGATFSIDYNQFGNIARITHETGQDTTYAYDESGEHLLSVTGPRGVISYSYLAEQGTPRAHALESITWMDGTHTYYEYDAQGRLSGQRRDEGVRAVSYGYPAPGAVSSTDVMGATMLAYFNDVGQVGEVEDALGHISRFRYNDLNQLIQASSPGVVARAEYDERGNLRGQINTLGQRIDTMYDEAHNRLVSLRDPLGITTAFSRDSDGDLVNLIYPDGSLERFDRDLQGNVLAETNRRGLTTRYTYDARGLVTRADLADGSHEEFTYDERGHLATVSDSRGMTTLTHDSAGRLTKIVDPASRSLEFTYGAGGRRLRMADHLGFAVNYAYDAAGRLTRLTEDGGGLMVAFHYDQIGRLARKELGNGTSSTYQYDAAGHLVHHAPDDAINSRFDYTYDSLGRRISMTTLDGITLYGYDLTGQLTSVVLPGGRTIRYEYDANGNRTRATDDGVSTDYSANNLNQYTSIGVAVYSYDVGGNLVAKTIGEASTHYAYDHADRLVSVVSPDGTWNYEYDAFGNRIASIHDGERTEYLIDPSGLGNVAAEYDSDGNLLVRYVTSGSNLVSRIDGAGAAYYDFDAVGSTAGITAASGDYVNRYAYLPFGELLSADEALENPFQYVGQHGVMREDNGLNFMRARFYAPAEGRFLNPDPIGFAGGDVNIHRYVKNSPVNSNDPSGLAEDVCEPAPPPEPIIPVPYDPSCDISGLVGCVLLIASFEVTGPLAIIAVGTGGIACNMTIQTCLGTPTLPDSGHDPQGPSGQPASPGSPDGEGYVPPLPSNPNRGDPADAGQADPPSFCNPKPVDRPENGYPPDELPDDIPDDKKDDSKSDQIVSGDPNDITGPAGYGDLHFVTPAETLPYTIRFENMPTATAAAQTVRITQQLDADLDYKTFELGDFGFGPTVVNVPAGRQVYEARIDARASVGLFVDVTANIDFATGVISWTFVSSDPQTFDLPLDPFAGFLPPNVSSPEGDGFVSYRVRPQANAATGTRIDAFATIVFDANDPIDTPAIFNTLDGSAPASSVLPLPSKTIAPTFPIHWGGDDGLGAGIARYDVFVSTNGGPFVALLSETQQTTALFDGQFGQQYAFYSVATDYVGHRQSEPLAAQASTYVTHQPTFESASLTAATQDALYQYAIATANADSGESLAITAAQLPAWLTLTDHGDGTATLSGTPSNANVGRNPVVLWVTDSAGASQVQSFVIAVENVDDAPTAMNLSRMSVFADLPGAWIAMVSVIDPDADDSHTLTVDDQRFTIDAGHLYLRAGVFLDRAAEPSVTLRITATDAGTPAHDFAKAFTLTVEDGPAVWDRAYQWAPNVLDVNADGLVSPLDALLIINELNASGPRGFIPRAGGTAPPNFFDTSGDDLVSPLDALLVINYLNAAGSGEAALTTEAFAHDEMWSVDDWLVPSQLACEPEGHDQLAAYLWDFFDCKGKREPTVPRRQPCPPKD